LNEAEYADLPNLPLRKIQLIPPNNTKPFDKVSFCRWRPHLIVPTNEAVDQEESSNGLEIGDCWITRQDGLLPHLGLNKPPVTYIYATKRNTSSENPKQREMVSLSG
jgi:hypothetical protein